MWLTVWKVSVHAQLLSLPEACRCTGHHGLSTGQKMPVHLLARWEGKAGDSGVPSPLPGHPQLSKELSLDMIS